MIAFCTSYTWANTEWSKNMAKNKKRPQRRGTDTTLISNYTRFREQRNDEYAQMFHFHGLRGHSCAIVCMLFILWKNLLPNTILCKTQPFTNTCHAKQPQEMKVFNCSFVLLQREWGWIRRGNMLVYFLTHVRKSSTWKGKWASLEGEC